MRIVTVVATLLSLLGCRSSDRSWDGSAFETAARQALASPHRLLRMADMKAPNWSEAQVLPPYWIADGDIAKDPRVVALGMHARDDVNGLVLRNGTTIVGVGVVKRDVVDLAPLVGIRLMPSECLRLSDARPPVASAAAC